LVMVKAKVNKWTEDQEVDSLFAICTCICDRN